MMTNRLFAIALAAALSTTMAAQAGRHEGKGFEPVTRDAAISRAAERFDRLDADSDGVVTDLEMRAARNEVRKGPRGAAHDARGPGVRDKRRAHGPKADRPGRRTGAVFGTVDADGDGMISPEEFAAAKDRVRQRKGGREDRGE